MQIQSQWRVGGFYGLQWNTDENEFHGEYRSGNIIDRTDYQSIIHEVYNVNVLHVAIQIVVHLQHLYFLLINVSLKTVVAASEQRFSTQQVISHIADGSTELQKSPNEAEVHGLTHDEHFFNNHEFFDAYLKMEALVLKHYQHRTPMNYTPLTFDLGIPLSREQRIPTATYQRNSYNKQLTYIE
ncbi:hypothetical protein Cgig2_023123 [Carnegiea gigantea]|uniref:Uncharacterized protein n=1 Tax=Carnegiea gigantea TaxID=171969 RepID=A0A9Q1Q5S4_9CARY|nr:hypothetical protein Cgig2_023123 [Carnegiea gigantea]